MTRDESAASGTAAHRPGRSPPPPRGMAAGTGIGTSARPSAGSDLHSGRLSYGSSAMHGTRLSYGTVGGHAGGAAVGMTPAPANASNNSILSPPSTSTASTVVNNNNVHSQSDFLAALSPTTAKYLRGQHETPGGIGIGARAAASGATPSAAVGTAASKAAANAMNLAANAARARGINSNDNDQTNGSMNEDDMNKNDNDETNNASQNQTAPMMNQTSPHNAQTSQLRNFVQSLLGMQLPASSSSSGIPTMMTTPDPTTASFYATSLLTQTSTIKNGTTYWRPDDAYLAARALSLKGEHKRAIYILDKVGLIGFGMGGDAASGGGGGSGSGMESNEGEMNFATGQQTNNNNLLGGAPPPPPAISNEQGIRNALLLRAESALLAGQCLIQAGEYERAITVYEEAMRYPPPPPPLEWGMYGYGYRLDNLNNMDELVDMDTIYDDEGEIGFDVKLADEMYIRSWREQSMSHMALIDDGDDERLIMLAANIRPLPFATTNHDGQGLIMEGIHPIARLCAARGVAYDEIANPHRAVPFLKMACAIDARCMEALNHIVKRRLLTPQEEREWIVGLNFGSIDNNGGGGDDNTMLGGMGISWLRDAYLARLRGGSGGLTLPPTTVHQGIEKSDGDNDGGSNILGPSPVPRVDMLSPSMLSLGSPDFAGGATGREGQDQQQAIAVEDQLFAAKQATSISQTVDDAFRNLSIHHNLGTSPDVLAHAAIRSYSAHDLRSALEYCTVLDSVDPYCRTAGYVHVATLVGLGLKRRLFQLAHRLVDTDPKDAMAWFAVGSYYYSCRRFDLAQRHFSRSTRLDPGSAECWIGFGCSFAVCDESDQALASFRAAQNKYSGSHVPLLYMGMEYLRTNHLSLAGHFLSSAQKTDPSDMLCCNELGVWSYRQGDMEDASFWFIKALRLHVAAESSALTSMDEALGANGYILLNRGQQPSSGHGVPVRQDAASNADTTTPYVKRRSTDTDAPPVSTILCALKTPSGQSIAASLFNDDRGMDSGLTDKECIERCKDQFWEPSIFNLGQSYRKMKRYDDAIVCFEKCSSLNPGDYAAYAALGFAKHLSGNVDGAIVSYHDALSRKPEDPFTSEMLTRALAEAVTYPPSLAMLSSQSPEAQGHSKGGIGSSILKKMGKSSGSNHAGMNNEPDDSMFTAGDDVDMSLA